MPLQRCRARAAAVIVIASVLASLTAGQSCGRALMPASLRPGLPRRLRRPSRCEVVPGRAIDGIYDVSYVRVRRPRS